MRQSGAAVESLPPRGDRLRFTSEGLLWLTAAVVLGGIGWLKSLNPLLLLAYFMLGLIVLNGVLARVHARRIRAARLPLQLVYAGERAREEFTAVNISIRPATAAIEDRGVHWNLSPLAGGTEVRGGELWAYSRRGTLVRAPLLVWSGFPFGFLRHERPGGPSDEITVLPALGQADADGMRRWLLRQAGGEGRSRKVLRRATTDQADIRGVRPYRPGDSLRAVHWRSSARRKELMVREYDAAPSPELLLVVEPWLPANPSNAALANLEAALSLAATVVRVWCRVIETRVTAVVAGKELSIETGLPTEAFARQAAIPLAEAHGTAEFAAIDPAIFGRAANRAARLVVSSRSHSPLAASLTRALGKPFLAVDPSARLPWYEPPGVL